MSNTIRKGIISVDAYGNGTETEFMLGNTAALSGMLITEHEIYLTEHEIYHAHLIHNEVETPASVNAYENGAETELMLVNTATLSGMASLVSLFIQLNIKLIMLHQL